MLMRQEVSLRRANGVSQLKIIDFGNLMIEEM